MRDVLTVEAASAQLEYDSHSIGGVITRQQIEDLPLNGRSFCNSLFAAGSYCQRRKPLGQYNRQFQVSVLGGDPDTTRITIDGEIVNDPVDGGTANLSQEVVQG